VIEAIDRFVRGAGEFSDDQQAETATHAVVVRSSHAMADRVSRQHELIKESLEHIVVYNKDSR
jgi:hypothetical protein